MVTRRKDDSPLAAAFTHHIPFVHLPKLTVSKVVEKKREPSKRDAETKIRSYQNTNDLLGTREALSPLIEIER